MATNQPGIAINIKGFLPTGKTLDEQFAALTFVKTAHETGDYSPLLKAAQDVEIKTESKTRRVEVEAPAIRFATAEPAPEAEPELTPEQIAQAEAGPEPATTRSRKE